MDISFYTSPMSEEIRDQGRAEGRVVSLFQLLALRGIADPANVYEKIFGCHDLQLLDRWFIRAVTASSIDEVFGEKQ